MRGPWGAPGQQQIVRVRVVMACGTDRIQIGWKVRQVAAGAMTLAAIAADVVNFVDPALRALLFDDERIESVDVVDLATKEGHQLAPAGLTGSIPAGSNRMPLACMCPVSMPGELRARYGRGGFYLPVRSEAWTENDVLNAGGIAALGGFVSQFADAYIQGGAAVVGLLAVNAHEALPARWNKKHTVEYPAVPATFYDVTSARLNQAISWVDSRKRGRGS